MKHDAVISALSLLVALTPIFFIARFIFYFFKAREHRSEVKFPDQFIGYATGKGYSEEGHRYLKKSYRNFAYFFLILAIYFVVALMLGAVRPS
ncbi:MAG TPA: hypothetical protein VE914_14440 [Candidatus Angelobacter sp.]|nr:hypothetical protein [Candidatus Angelobacter sp.]